MKRIDWDFGVQMSPFSQRIQLGLGVVGSLAMSYAILQLLWMPSASHTLSTWDDLLAMISTVSMDQLQDSLFWMLASVPFTVLGIRGVLGSMGIRSKLGEPLAAVLLYSIPAIWLGVMMQVVQLALSFQSASNPVRLADAAWHLLSPANLMLNLFFWGAGAVIAALVLVGKTSLSRWSLLAFPQVLAPCVGLLGSLAGGAMELAFWLVSWPVACAFTFAMLAASSNGLEEDT